MPQMGIEGRQPSIKGSTCFTGVAVSKGGFFSGDLILVACGFSSVFLLNKASVCIF